MDVEKDILGWLRGAAQAGSSILKKENALRDILPNIEYLEGNQVPVRSKELSKVFDNRIKKIVFETVSSLTDVRPIWAYTTDNPKYKPQADLLSKLARAWWRNSLSDIRLQDALKWACVGGSGYISPIWNPDLNDIELIALDPRNVIPLRPTLGSSLQEWNGVMIRQRKSIWWLRNKYPLKAGQIQGGGESWFEPEARPSRGGFGGIFTSAWDIMTGKGPAHGDAESGTTDYIMVYVKDGTIWEGPGPLQVGPPGASWSYIVYPVGSIHPITGTRVTESQAMRWPRGRLIICTPTCILDQVPNPNLSGMFPLVRFTLDPTPWSLLGIPLVTDLRSLQDALNETLRGIDDGVKKWVRPNVKADMNSISKALLDKYDPRSSGQKLRLNPSAAGGIEEIAGPTFPPWLFSMVEFYKNEIDEAAYVKGLRELSKLKQAPAAETIEKFMDAQTPGLRLRGRSIEQSLCDLGEHIKSLIFQHYDAKRRVQMLGEDGLTLEDFDFDPGQLVPALEAPREPRMPDIFTGDPGDLGSPGDPDYTPELDSRLSRADRAAVHQKNFTFSVTPNSFLNVSHMGDKLLKLQLWRSSAIDIWSVLEAMDIPGVGEIPKGSVIDRIEEARRRGLQPGDPPEVVQARIQMQLAQAQMALAQMGAVGGPGGPPPGPGGGPPPPDQPRVSGSGPEGGRPPSAQQAPTPVLKDQGTRMVISESGR